MFEETEKAGKERIALIIAAWCLFVVERRRCRSTAERERVQIFCKKRQEVLRARSLDVNEVLGD
jgi:hypothetical protein